MFLYSTSSEDTHLTLKNTKYSASCESFSPCPTRCHQNQLLTRNLSISTLLQDLLRKGSDKMDLDCMCNSFEIKKYLHCDSPKDM